MACQCVKIKFRGEKKRTFCKIKCGTQIHLEASKGNRNNYT